MWRSTLLSQTLFAGPSSERHDNPYQVEADQTCGFKPKDPNAMCSCATPNSIMPGSSAGTFGQLTTMAFYTLSDSRDCRHRLDMLRKVMQIEAHDMIRSWIDGYERHMSTNNAVQVTFGTCNSTCRMLSLPGVLHEHQVVVLPALAQIITIFLCPSRLTTELAPGQTYLNAIVGMSLSASLRRIFRRRHGLPHSSLAHPVYTSEWLTGCLISPLLLRV